MGEEELPFEALAALPDEILFEAFEDWVSTSNPGKIAQVKVGMVVNAVRLKYGAELVDPIPKKKPEGTIPAAGAVAKNLPEAAAPQTPLPQSLPEQQPLQNNPFIAPGQRVDGDATEAPARMELDPPPGIFTAPSASGDNRGNGELTPPMFPQARERRMTLNISVQLSTVIDQGMGQEIPQLPLHKLEELRARYSGMFGEDPLEEADPSDKQLTALAWKLEAGLTPIHRLWSLGAVRHAFPTRHAVHEPRADGRWKLPHHRNAGAQGP